ncbi:MAG TPA: uroporphyrinogen-III synthase [Steroidobacteraceae bacterium]|nr:uroporphyrinogen-III synthase [Steroidobacteraceae bacterium]
MNDAPLAGRTIAVPETRELDLFAGLLERRGAIVLRCPLVAIRDAPDPAPVLEWIRAFAAGSCDDLILLTGEGLRRLLGCIERHEPQLKEPFVGALARVRTITRGPKPARALKELGLKAQLPAGTPTSAGVIETLRALDLTGRTIGLQLYGSEPNRPLAEFLEQAGARVLPVAPYVYADAADAAAVRALIDRLAAREVDAIAFTSTPQVERLFAVAPAETVRAALARTLVAAVGPIVAGALAARGLAPAIVPEEAFFMKPLTAALEVALKSRA